MYQWLCPFSLKDDNAGVYGTLLHSADLVYFLKTLPLNSIPDTLLNAL